MHPMEHLRWVASMDSSPVDVLAREAAHALAGCAGQPAELVVAARRLLDRHPAVGPLWWVASRALTAPDPSAALWDALGALEHDPTPLLIETERAARPDAVVLLAWSFGRDGAFGDVESVHAAQAAHGQGREVLVGGGVGRALPAAIWDVVIDRVQAFGPGSPALLSWDSVDAVVAADGPVTPDLAVASASCPIAPELLAPRSARGGGHGALPQT